MSTQGEGVVERLDEWIRTTGTLDPDDYHTSIRAQDVVAAREEITRLRTLLSSSRGEQPVRVLRIGAIGDQRVRVIQEATNQGAPTFFLVDDGRIGFCQPDLIKPSKERVPWQTQTSSREEQPKTHTAREVLTYLYSESKWEEDVDGDIDGPIVHHNVRIRDGLLDELLDMAEIPRGRYDETPLKRLDRANEEDQNGTIPSAPGSVPTSLAGQVPDAAYALADELKLLSAVLFDDEQLVAVDLIERTIAHISAAAPQPTSVAGQVPDAAKEEAAAAYFRSAIADGQAAILLADLATYDNVLRELGIQESHKHPVDEVRRIQRIAETAHDQGVETAAKLIDRKVSDYTSEHGSLDPETGAMEFSRSGEEYVSTLEELAEEIRAINAAPQPTAGGDAPTPGTAGEGGQ